MAGDDITGAIVKKLGILFAAAMALLATPTMAYDTAFIGKITMIEPSYMPGAVYFIADNGASSCPAGTFLKWVANGATDADQIANTQAILSMLVTAKATGEPVGIYVTYSGCIVNFLHFM